MLSILYRLPGKSPFARGYALLSPSRVCHRYLQLCLICVISHVPLCCVLAVSVLEERVDAGSSLTTRCSPRVESLWILFRFFCGLLAAIINAYCVDQLTSSPAQRRQRPWLQWWRQRQRPASARDSGYSSRRDSSSSAAGRASSEMTNTRPVSAASSSDRVGTPQLTPTSSTGTSPDEPLSPADGFSPHGRQPPPAADGHPPTYQQATAMPLHSAQPALITIPAASPRPPIVRRQAHPHIPTQRLLHHNNSSSAARKSPFCLFLLLLAACSLPLIASSYFPELFRSSAYTHACSSYDWEVLLTAPSPDSQILPSAEFISRTATPAHAFKMQMQMQMQMHSRNTTAYSQLLPPQQRLTWITYDTGMHSYRAMFMGTDVAVVGGYAGMRFVELGLHGEGVWHDYFGFPRGVVERVDGDVVAAVHVGRVKRRRDCEKVKVCVRGVETAVAAVVVGSLLVETVEAAGKCRLGGR